MTHVRPTAVCLLLAMTTLAGCSAKPAPDQAATGQTPAAVQPAGGPGPAEAPGSAPMPGNGQPGVRTVTGTVKETMDAASYTYVRVDTGAGEVWAAAGHFEVAVGDRVVVPLETPMQNFHSQTLGRDFPLVYFASAIVREGQPLRPALPPGHRPTSRNGSGADAATVTGVIEPAEGGSTVADVWARRATLAGETVTVRGKVVKFNGGILGRNWLHIQDGTGARTEGTHDLTVTSSAAARVGDVVTVTGTVAVDKDFGAGYAYAVIVENAKVEIR